MTQEDPKVEIPIIKVQLDNIQRTVNEVKLAVTDLIKIGTTVAVLSEQQISQGNKLNDLTIRVSDIEARLTSNSAYLNKIRGGFSLTVTLVTLVQAAVLAGASWLLTSVLETRENVTIVQQSVKHMEQEQSRLIEAFLHAGKEAK